MLVDADRPSSALFLILHGELLVTTPDDAYARGPGQVVGEWEKLDGSDDVRVTAKTDVRVVVVDRAAYEAAVSG